MNALSNLRCVMKIRTCGAFWYKAAVSLSYPTDKAHDPLQQGLLTIDRPKPFGRTLEIPLGRSGRIPTLIFASEKDQRHRQLTVCYGVWRRCVTLRVSTDAIYTAWWTALETAYMSLQLKQISRTLPSNINAQPEMELQEREGVNGTKEATMFDAVMKNEVPLLEVSTPTSALHDSYRDSWQSDEDPDELVVVGSTTEFTANLGAESSEFTTDMEAMKNARIWNVDHATCRPRDMAPSGACSDGGASSWIGSDVLGYLPGDLRDVMESCSSDSANSYSTNSSLASSVRDHLPSEVFDLLESCPIPTECVSSDSDEDSQCCSFNRDFAYALPHGENLFHRGYLRDSKSVKLSTSGSDVSVGESMAPTEDTTTVSTATASTRRDALDDALAAIEAGETSTAETFALPNRSGSTPFQRLLLRQRWSAKRNARRTGDDVASHSSRERVFTPNRPRRERSYGDDYTCQSGHGNISSPRPRAESTTGSAEGDATNSLTVGRINKARVEEIEEFALRRVSGTARASKKTIVVERITKAWADVARFAFRPNADIDTNHTDCHQQAVEYAHHN
ncbi:hypothetical protein PF007_g2807 [Phytophthora fragariae]|uniref:Uncharacterized protein n=2 Tax=Phytophthora fragariae TaxID=53985 RepID=A0A6A3TIX2_9STRA|nr:hypothetical protein PF003_g27186 [Phytophthora fragariae]KAE9134811.1 hypothetical protein PF007_g2807 [Phytophthora fragariae]KAE9251978.1 hypothetical protein PF004_g2207 [Phytophthora fragariae]